MADLAIISFPVYLSAEEQTPAGQEAIKDEIRESLAKPDMDISIEIEAAGAGR